MQLAVGGPLTGLAFGVATTVWLRYMYNNATAEITLTVLSAYGTYVVANELLDVSAVLAVVVLGWLIHLCNVCWLAQGTVICCDESVFLCHEKYT